MPRVTGVRHWSTPDYTRVAIDVEKEVKFGSQRISNPDRIFFDLRDTKLASTLVGKTFDVDDGFLKTIRVAEFQPGRTRIVLEVDDLARYDAFLLPDPYRLIIDIHGKDNHGKQNQTTVAANADLSGADAVSDKGSSGRSASGAASAPTDGSELTAANGNSKARVAKTQRGSGKDAVRFSKPGLVETDLSLIHIFDLGKTQVLKWEVAQSLYGLVGRDALFPDLIEQLTEGLGVHMVQTSLYVAPGMRPKRRLATGAIAVGKEQVLPLRQAQGQDDNLFLVDRKSKYFSHLRRLLRWFNDLWIDCRCASAQPIIVLLWFWILRQVPGLVGCRVRVSFG